MRAKTKARFSHEDTDHQSSHSAAAALIGSNDDLLTEILVSFCRFKSVSKHFRYLLSHTSFTSRYDTQHFRNSPIGLYIYCDRYRFNPYIPFDEEARSDPPFHTLDLYSYADPMRILQSCNGLLFFSSSYSDVCDRKYYVFNPTTRQLVNIPSISGYICFMGFAFHQTDCAHYKVVCILKLEKNLIGEEELYQIKTYSSDTHEWKISIESFSARCPIYGSGFYWNGAVYWAISDHSSYMYFKVDVEQLQTLPLPVETMQVKTRKMYIGESRGHLHLIVYDQHEHNLLPLKVYEVLMDHSGWFVKYHVELDVFLELQVGLAANTKTLAVIDVIRGEKDEDTFMVLLMKGSYITYNVHDKSFKLIHKLNNLYMGLSPLSTTFHRCSQTLASF